MSTLRKFVRIITGDQNLNQIQTNITKVVDDLSIQPLITGNLLKSVSLVVGSNTIFHGLNAPLRGWIPTRVRGVATSLFDEQETNPTPAKTLILNSSEVVTIDLVVF